VTGDVIEIRQLAVNARVGVYQWEQQVRQQLLLDLALVLAPGQVARVAASDQLEQALDYSAIASCVETFVAEHPVQLLETLAENLADHLLKQFDFQTIRLSITKPAAVACASAVSLCIQRPQ
jgi:dihydroneopterin aldolase